MIHISITLSICCADYPRRLLLALLWRQAPSPLHSINWKNLPCSFLIHHICQLLYCRIRHVVVYRLQVFKSYWTLELLLTWTKWHMCELMIKAFLPCLTHIRVFKQIWRTSCPDTRYLTFWLFSNGLRTTCFPIVYRTRIGCNGKSNQSAADALRCVWLYSSDVVKSMYFC